MLALHLNIDFTVATSISFFHLFIYSSLSRTSSLSLLNSLIIGFQSLVIVEFKVIVLYLGGCSGRQWLLWLGWVVGVGVARLGFGGCRRGQGGLSLFVVSTVDCQCLSWQKFQSCHGSGLRVVHEVALVMLTVSILLEVDLVLGFSHQCVLLLGQSWWLHCVGHGLQLVWVENKLF